MRLSPSPLCVLSSPSAGLRRGRSGMEKSPSASVLDQVRTIAIGFGGSRTSTMSMRAHSNDCSGDMKPSAD
jgi:hypothetical protein